MAVKEDGARLYIDGTLMDVSENAKISLTYKSNLLTDVDKIVSNYSYTITLPLTTHNRAALLGSSQLGSDTLFPYQRHKCDYYQNGVQLIKDGTAVLLSIGTNIQVALTWGVSDAFAKMVKQGTTLDKLQGDETLPYELEVNYCKWEDLKKTGYFYGWMELTKYPSDADQRTFMKEHGIFYPYCRPLARVQWVLGKMQEQFGVQFTFPSDVADGELPYLLMPLISHEATELSVVQTTLTPTALPATGAISLVSAEASNVFDNITPGTAQKEFKCNEAKTITVTIDATFTTRTRLVAHYAANWLGVGIAEVGEKDSTDDNRFYAYNGSWDDNGNYVATMHRTTDVDVVAGGGIWFHLFPGADKDIAKAMGKYTSVTLSIKAALKAEQDVQFGQRYPIMHNLPSIKCVDLLKYLGAIWGCFPRQLQGTNEVRWVHYDELYTNWQDAVDWSGKLVATMAGDYPQELSFTQTDFAQRNVLKYKADDSVPSNVNADGVLVLNNETLDAERNMAEFPFAATYNNSIELYECNNLDDVIDKWGDSDQPAPAWSAQKVEARIMLAKQTPKRVSPSGAVIGGGMVYPSFKGLEMQPRIVKYYTPLQNALFHTKIIKEQFRLSEVDLVQFDETLPVYLRQYGAYFAVLELTTGGTGGLVTAKLLKLNQQTIKED